MSGITVRHFIETSALHPSRGVDDVEYETDDGGSAAAAEVVVGAAVTALNEHDYVLAPHRTGSTFYFSKTLGIVRSG